MDFLYVIGISHKVADISIREKFYIPMDIKVNALETSSFNELLILATCNRTEIYVVSEKALQEKDLIDYVCSLAKQNASDFSNYFYVKQGDQVVDHLMHVCAGLDSVALGEDQILHQISRAYETAHQCHATGNVLNKLFQGAIRTTKRIKTETNLSKLSCNIPFLSMKRVLKKFDDLEKRSVYIVGLGEIGSLMLKYVQENTTHIYATSRTFANAQKFADVLTPIPFEDRYKVLEKCDVLILCSACKEPIIKKDEFEKFVNRPILVIDLGSPRNAESTIGNIPFVDYVCVDELQKVVDENRRQRMVEMLAAKQILQEGIDEFMHWRCMDDVVKKISERAERLINSAKNEACELLRSMPKIDEDSRSKIEMLYVRFAKRVANEFLYKVKDNNTQSDVIKFLECLEK